MNNYVERQASSEKKGEQIQKKNAKELFMKHMVKKVMGNTFWIKIGKQRGHRRMKKKPQVIAVSKSCQMPMYLIVFSG